MLALAIAAAFRLHEEWKDLRLAMQPHESVGPDLAQRRMEACAKCPIYSKPLQTCGTPLRRKGDFAGMGCYCFMPEKSETYANCWATEQGLSMGWPKELNSTPQ